MGTSVVFSFLNLVDSSSIHAIARRLGEPGEAVSRGLESATASLINRLAAQSSDPTAKSRIFRLISEAPPDVNVSNLTGAAAGSGEASSATAFVLDSGKKLLSVVFGANQSSIVHAISKSVGLRSSSVTSLLRLAAALLITALGRLVRSDRLTPKQLGNFLVNQSSGVQSLLPTGRLQHFIGTAPAATIPNESAKPVAVGAISEPRRWLPGWLWVITARFWC
jgi:hypothetical protein